MTDRLIVATFKDTNAAYDAASAIKDLKSSGLADFKLKAGVMVKKDDRGNVSLIEDRNRPLVGAAVGTAAGALIVCSEVRRAWRSGRLSARRRDSAAML
jgi:uncharacterized membrane protein